MRGERSFAGGLRRWPPTSLRSSRTTTAAPRRCTRPAASRSPPSAAWSAPPARTGPLGHKTKELIALAIAIATRCEGCIVFHARACLRLGVTREELLEMIGVAVEMGGGPFSVYGATALACFDRMAEGTAG